MLTLDFCLQGYAPPPKNGVEQKRPGRPLNITSLVRLSSAVPNQISVTWAPEIGKVRKEAQVGNVLSMLMFMRCDVWRWNSRPQSAVHVQKMSSRGELLSDWRHQSICRGGDALWIHRVVIWILPHTHFSLKKHIYSHIVLVSSLKQNSRIGRNSNRAPAAGTLSRNNLLKRNRRHETDRYVYGMLSRHETLPDAKHQWSTLCMKCLCCYY